MSANNVRVRMRVKNLSSSRLHEKPTNCGTKATDVFANFFKPANFNENALNILVHL